MQDQGIDQLRSSLGKADQIGIAVGKNPTLDTMGAALSLFLALEAAGKTVSIASPTDPIVAISSLVGIDKVKRNFTVGGDTLVVSFPYTGKNIEKASYTEENGSLNIIVKAAGSGLGFTEKDVQFRLEGGAPSLLIVVGTPSLTDLGALYNPDILKDTTVVNIDTKRENQGFGDIVLLSPELSSLSEYMAGILSRLQYSFDVDIAQNLMSGIGFATNNFQKLTTSPLAFEMAGLLMKKGAKRQQPQVSAPQSAHDRDKFFNQPQPVQPQPVQPQRPQPYQQQPRPQQPQRPSQPPRQSTPQQPANPAWNQPRNAQNEQIPEAKDIEDTPPDWLTPKVYKGSTEL